MSAPLNAHLFGRLTELFGHVNITDQGTPQTGVVETGATLRKRWRAIVPGEHYLVNCIFCRDTRHRLQFNHCWGVLEPQSGSRRWWGVHCFNEASCFDGDTARGQWNLHRLKRMVYDGTLPHEHRAVIVAPTEPPLPPGPVTLPGTCIPITSLPPDNPGVAYLWQRSFDPYYVGHWWSLFYCVDAPQFGLAGRIIIPIFEDGKFVAWQARLAGEADWQRCQKYLNGKGQHARHHIYALDQAIAANVPFITLVEGATSCWRLGFGTVALLGKTMTGAQQVQLIRAAKAAGKPVVIALDGDSDKASTLDSRESIQRILTRNGVVTIPLTLPAGTQPDGLHQRGEFWPLAASTAASLGITLY